jgi:hypothetical protein
MREHVRDTEHLRNLFDECANKGKGVFKILLVKGKKRLDH